MFKKHIQSLIFPQISLYMIAMMFCLPFIVAYHDIPIADFYGEWLAAVIGLLALPVIINNHQLPKISLVFLGLLLISNVQLLAGIQYSSSYTLLIQLYMAWAFLLTVLGHYLRQALGWEKLSNTLATALIIAATINVVFVALQILQQSGISIPIPRLQSYGMLAQSNHFADFISLAMVSLMYVYAKQRIRFQTLLISLLAGLLMLSFSGSRSSVLYLAFIALLSFFLDLKNKGEEVTAYRQLFKISLLLLPLFFLIQLLLSCFPQLMIQTPVTRAMVAIGDQSTSLRWEFWQTSLHLFSQHPWLGIGAGQTRWNTYLLTDNSTTNPAQIFFEHAHNLFIHLFAEMGIFAGLLVIIGLTLWVVNFLKKREFTLENWWLFTIIGIIGIHSMLEYPLWYSYFLGIFAFLVGAGDERTIDLNRLSHSAQRLLKAAFIVMIIYGVQQLYQMQTAYEKLEKQIAVASQAEISDAQKQQLVEDMLWVNESSLLGPYAELVLATLINPSQAQVDIQTNLTESALKFIPLRKPALNYVVLLEMQQRHQEALQHLKRILLIAGGDLEGDMQQLSPEHKPVLQTLLAEINK